MTSDHKSIINNRSLNAFCCSSFHDLATHVSIHLVHRSIHLSIQCRCMIVIRILSSLFSFLFFFFFCSFCSLSFIQDFSPRRSSMYREGKKKKIRTRKKTFLPRMERRVVFFSFSLCRSFPDNDTRNNEHILCNCNFVEIRKVPNAELIASFASICFARLCLTRARSSRST